MTSLALALVLTSAILYAFWNLTTKRINGGVEAVWLFTAVSAVVFAPIAALVCMLERPYIGPIQLVFLAGSGILQMIYFIMLSRGYQVGELSVVYPLARGTGPLLATGLAIVLLGEHPKALTIIGAVLICLGVFLIATSGRRRCGGVPKSDPLWYRHRPRDWVLHSLGRTRCQRAGDTGDSPGVGLRCGESVVSCSLCAETVDAGAGTLVIASTRHRDGRDPELGLLHAGADSDVVFTG